MHFILKLQKSLYPAFNRAHGPEMKNKDKIKTKVEYRVSQKKQKSVEAVREEEVKLRG